MKKWKKHWKEIDENIDWVRIERAMKCVGLKLVDGDINISLLRNKVKGLIKDVYKEANKRNTDWYIGTGGFNVGYDIKQKIISVEFILTSWDSYE